MISYGVALFVWRHPWILPNLQKINSPRRMKLHPNKGWTRLLGGGPSNIWTYLYPSSPSPPRSHPFSVLDASLFCSVRRGPFSMEPWGLGTIWAPRFTPAANGFGAFSWRSGEANYQFLSLSLNVCLKTSRRTMPLDPPLHQNKNRLQ